MNKILLIHHRRTPKNLRKRFLLGATIIGILLVGTISAVSISLINTNFKTKVTTISSFLFYEKLLNSNEISLKSIPKNTELDLSDSNLEITKNKEGVIMVRTK